MRKLNFKRPPRVVIDTRDGIPTLNLLDLTIAASAVMVGVALFIYGYYKAGLMVLLVTAVFSIFKIQFPLQDMESIPSFEVSIFAKVLQVFKLLPIIIQTIIIFLLVADLLAGTSYILGNSYTKAVMWVLIFSEILLLIIELVQKHLFHHNEGEM